MRVFLRTKKRGLYYRGGGQFSADLGDATAFASVAAASACALSDKLPDTGKIPWGGQDGRHSAT
jgi:hypothetical protein